MDVKVTGPSKRSAVRINELARRSNAKRYLEIGVSGGRTFHSVEIEYKTAVDPVFKFDWKSRESANERYFLMPSDTWFEKHSAGEKFDIILIDGLHTFEQTLRDFCNCMSVAHDKTIFVIDDTLPTDVYSSWPSQREAVAFRRSAIEQLGLDPATQKMGAWHGDVFKLVFFVHDFFPTISYRTVTDGNGQTVMWFAPRENFAPKFNALDPISRMTYFDLQANMSCMNMGTDAEVHQLVFK